MPLFRAYTTKPAVAFYPEDDGVKATPPLAATLKFVLESKHEGLVFRVSAGDGERRADRRFRIQNVSGTVYDPKMVGETDAHGPYRIVSTEELFENPENKVTF